MPDLPLPLATGLQERLVLLLNHVLSREPAAVERLRPLAGQALLVSLLGQPAWAPQLPPLALLITPAGLFELGDAATEPQLRISIDGSNPLDKALGLLKGERRGVSVSGAVELAAAINWLFENLRWDLGDELSRLLGAAPAHGLEQAARALREQLAALLRRR